MGIRPPHFHFLTVVDGVDMRLWQENDGGKFTLFVWVWSWVGLCRGRESIEDMAEFCSLRRGIGVGTWRFIRLTTQKVYQLHSRQMLDAHEPIEVTEKQGKISGDKLVLGPGGLQRKGEFELVGQPKRGKKMADRCVETADCQH